MLDNYQDMFTINLVKKSETTNYITKIPYAKLCRTYYLHMLSNMKDIKPTKQHTLPYYIQEPNLGEVSSSR